jgi:hypothetical protein
VIATQELKAQQSDQKMTLRGDNQALASADTKEFTSQAKAFPKTIEP